MIFPILEHINSNIEALNIIRELHLLCELQENGTQTFPCEYQADGEFKQLSLDNAQAETYHRHDGPVSIQNTAIQIAACNSSITKTFPMIIVGFMKRKVTGRDNAFIPDNVCEVICNAIDQKTAKALTTTLGAITTSVNVKSYSVDTGEIFNKEFKGADKLNLDYFMFEIKYEVVVVASQSCFKNWCEIEC